MVKKLRSLLVIGQKHDIKLKDVFLFRCGDTVLFLKKNSFVLRFDSTSRINQVLISSKGEFKCYEFGIRKHYYLLLGYSIDAMDSSSKFSFTVTFMIMLCFIFG